MEIEDLDFEELANYLDGIMGWFDRHSSWVITKIEWFLSSQNISNDQTTVEEILETLITLEIIKKVGVSYHRFNKLGKVEGKFPFLRKMELVSKVLEIWEEKGDDENRRCRF